MRLNVSAFWSGLLAAWLALAGILAMPVAGPMRMMTGGSRVERAFTTGISVDGVSLDTAPICGDHEGSPADHDPQAMTDCMLCLCCAPLMALLSEPPAPPPPSQVVVATIAIMPPARAPPGMARSTGYPRGPPPASI